MEKKIEKNQVTFPRFNDGVAVEAGKTWVTGLTHEQRQQALVNHENRWKKRYNQQVTEFKLSRGF